MSKHSPPPEQTILQLRRDEIRTGWSDLSGEALRTLRGKKVRAQDIQALRGFTGRGKAPPFVQASNGLANWAVGYHTARQLRDIRTAVGVDLMHVTIVLDSWATSEASPQLRLSAIKAQARKILECFGPNWIARIELSTFGNVNHPDGTKLITPHVHAIVWGHGVAVQSRTQTAYLNRRRQSPEPTAPAVYVSRVGSKKSDILNVATYPYKAPRAAKNRYVCAGSGRVQLNESQAPLRRIRLLRLLELNSLLTLSALAFASGDGTRVRRVALEAGRRAVGRVRGSASQASLRREVEKFWRFFYRRYPISHTSRFRRPAIE